MEDAGMSGPAPEDFYQSISAASREALLSEEPVVGFFTEDGYFLDESNQPPLERIDPHEGHTVEMVGYDEPTGFDIEEYDLMPPEVEAATSPFAWLMDEKKQEIMKAQEALTRAKSEIAWRTNERDNHTQTIRRLKRALPRLQRMYDEAVAADE